MAGVNLAGMGRVEDAILKNLDVFVGFARSRLGDHHLAEDVVQDSLMKALSSDRHPTRTKKQPLGFNGSCERRLSTCIGRKASRALERFEMELPERPNENEEKDVQCPDLRRIPGQPLSDSGPNCSHCGFASNGPKLPQPSTALPFGAAR